MSHHRKMTEKMTEGQIETIVQLVAEALTEHRGRLPFVPVQRALNNIECFRQDLLEMLERLIEDYTRECVHTEVKVEMCRHLRDFVKVMREELGLNISVFDREVFNEEVYNVPVRSQESLPVKVSIFRLPREMTSGELVRECIRQGVREADPWTFMAVLEKVAKDGLFCDKPYPQILFTHWPVGGEAYCGNFGWYFLSSWKGSQNTLPTVYAGKRMPDNIWASGSWFVGVERY